jgi:hypothetical protein
MSPAQANQKRAVLIHWKPEEGETHLPALRKAGWTAECLKPDGSAGLAGLRSNPPQAIVIDLGRLPSQGRAVGTALRQYKQTRHVPLVFVGGAADKLETLRRDLPDAVFTTWDQIVGALSDALRKAPDEPVVPSTMAGYSGTPLWKKLGIKAGSSLVLLKPPQGFREKLTLPEAVEVRDRAAASDRVLLFLRSSKDLERWFATAAKAVTGNSGLWLIWPKKTSGIDTDLNENLLRGYGLQHGWVDFKVCAVDETWSGLQFARKRT